MRSSRILIVDDHESVRSGLRSLLSTRAKWLVCGEAADGLEAVQQAISLRPDIVLMDISMPQMDGVEATRIIRREVPEAKVIIISQNHPAIVSSQAAQIGASGYVAKADLSRDLLATLDRVVECRNPEAFVAQNVDPGALFGNECHKPLEVVLRTAELKRRPSRSADYEAESRALVALAEEMANSPQTVLQKLADLALELCRAHSAGVSILEVENGREIFRWHAVAGRWSGYIGGTMPRDFSPCGTVLDTNATLLLSHPERHFPIPPTVAPPIVEVLLIPFRIAGEPVGTIWVIAHDESRQFDAEDERLMTSLGKFASSAYQNLKSLAAIKIEAANREKAEVALTQNEANLRDFVESATIGMHWVAQDGRILWTNQAELDLLGYTREEYIGRHIAEFHADAPVIEDMLTRLSRGDILREYEARLITKDGAIRYVLISSSAFFEGGEFVHNRCLTVDVTKRRQLENQLRENERRFREMIDALPAAIYTTDAEGRLTHFNPAAVEFSGRMPELGTDRWCVSWKMFRPDGTPWPLDECPMAVALKGGRIVDGAEAIAERPDGKRVWFAPYPRPVRDREGKIVGGINMLLDITERKQADRAIGLLAAIVDSSDDAIISMDLDSKIISWNRSAERLFGYTAEEAIGHHITLIVPPNLRDEEAAVLDRLKRSERIEHCETVRLRKDGTTIDISLTISPVKDAAGCMVGASRVPRDITERKQAERASGLLAAIVDSSDDAIISKSLDGIITSWNRSAERLFGYTAEEAIGRHITLIVPLDRRHEDAAILDRLNRGERVEHFETVRVRKDGAVLDISLTISPVKDAAGRVVGASKMARDITQQKQSERALRESEERFRTIVETTPECVKLVSSRGTLLQMNSSGLAMVGAGCADMVVGKNIYDLIAPEDRDRFRAFNERICGGEKGSLEYDIVGLRGNRLCVETHGAPLGKPDGTIVQLAVTRDVTERKRAQEGLLRSEERLRALAETLDKEVRTRTAELERRNTEVLEQSERLRDLSAQLIRVQDQERRHIARELHDSAGQILTALGLNLANISQRAMRDPLLAKDVGDSQELLRQLNKEIRTMSYLLHPPLLDENGLPQAIRWYIQGLMERSGLNIELNTSEGFGRLPSEIELALFRIVQECLTNIHRHSGSQSARVRITRKADSVSLEIQDEGKGISAERLAALQTHCSGVGIAGMRERVRHIGGALNIQSTDTGTTICVTLPAPMAATSKLSIAAG